MDEQTVRLREHDAALAAHLVAEGRYASADEVVGAAMDALRDAVLGADAAAWDAIRAGAAEGEAAIARGDYVELSTDADLDAYLDAIMARVKAEACDTPHRA